MNYSLHFGVKFKILKIISSLLTNIVSLSFILFIYFFHILPMKCGIIEKKTFLVHTNYLLEEYLSQKKKYIIGKNIISNS